LGAFKRKVLCPRLCTRIEEGRNHVGDGVDTRQIRPFVSIAFKACECEVEVCGGATVFAGNDMVNLMGQGHIVLMQLVILAPFLGALPDASTQR
jgi:hypothetical protein